LETCYLPSEKQQTGVRVSRDLLVKVRHIAVDRNANLNDIIEQALMEWYDRQPERAKYGPAEPSKPVKPGRPIKLVPPPKPEEP
jgi:hypothetical protein